MSAQGNDRGFKQSRTSQMWEQWISGHQCFLLLSLGRVFKFLVKKERKKSSFLTYSVYALDHSNLGRWNFKYFLTFTQIWSLHKDFSENLSKGRWWCSLCSPFTPLLSSSHAVLYLTYHNLNQITSVQLAAVIMWPASALKAPPIEIGLGFSHGSCIQSQCCVCVWAR